jgi:predicted NBD/HSP70 family sugar kinase
LGTLIKQSQSSVKRNNLQLVLSTILQHEPLARADLVRLTHMSKPAVSSLIDELIGRGLISEIGAGESKGGRKPILLRFNSDRHHLLAFEMGRAGYKAAVADLKGKLLGKTGGTFPVRASFPRRLGLLKEAILRLLQTAEIPCSSLLKSVCIAPGIYVERGKALQWTSDPAGGRNEELEECFREVFRKPPLVQHSTKLSLLGEKVAGRARAFRNVIYVDFAYGLGCALMIDGRLYSGAQDSAGEIGYIYSSLEEYAGAALRPCELGRLEGRISGKALAEQGAAAVLAGTGGRLGELVGGEAAAVSGKTVFDAYAAGDAEAGRILREGFGYFNMALCNAINLLAPEAVILGGGFAAAGQALLELVSAGVRDRVLVQPRIELSELGAEASLVGGIHFLIEHTDFLTEL